MFSAQRISRVTAIALTAGAVAAPVASARPARMAPNAAAAAISASQQQVSAAARPAAPVPLIYSRQDKQLAPSSSSQAPVNVAPASVRAGTASDGFDWGDAGIGAGGALAISIIGIGGGLALSQRRTRRTRPTVAAAS
ncbi:MAG: hypothetical protein ACTHQQ_17245 [Solirubrobacteraceae bacterium]